jgi:predicted ATPase
MGLPYFLCLMAECHAASGDPKRALAAVDEALGSARRNGAHFQLSEMLRVKAEVTSQVRGSDEAQIETLFRTAVETARGQGALLPELRAATGYARYLTERRRRTEATDLLLPYAGLILDVGGSVEAKAAAEFV